MQNLLIGNIVIGSIKIKKDMHVIDEGLFIPLFLRRINVDLSTFLSVDLFALIIIIINKVEKIVECDLGTNSE